MDKRAAKPRAARARAARATKESPKKTASGPPPRPENHRPRKAAGMPSRPEPRNKGGDRTPEANLAKAEVAMGELELELGRQLKHKGNVGWDFDAVYNRIEVLSQTYAEKGFSPQTRDLTYDWAGFLADVRKAGQDLRDSVGDFLKDRAARMVWDTDPTTGKDRLTEEERNAVWAEAENNKSRIAGFSQLIRRLRARGCEDPEEPQIRGGRQQGGRRR